MSSSNSNPFGVKFISIQHPGYPNASINIYDSLGYACHFGLTVKVLRGGGGRDEEITGAVAGGGGEGGRKDGRWRQQQQLPRRERKQMRKQEGRKSTEAHFEVS